MLSKHLRAFYQHKQFFYSKLLFRFSRNFVVDTDMSHVEKFWFIVNNLIIKVYKITLLVFVLKISLLFMFINNVYNYCTACRSRSIFLSDMERLLVI